MTSVFTHYKLQMHYQHIKVKNLKSKEDFQGGHGMIKIKLKRAHIQHSKKNIKKINARWSSL